MQFRPACVLILLFLAFAVPQRLVAADTVVLSDGEVLFGSVERTGPGEAVVRPLGGDETRLVHGVAKIDAGLDPLLGNALEFTLKDDSVLRGKLVDVDEELGVFADISFGVLRLPFGAIKRTLIYDDFRASERGVSATLGLSALGAIGSDSFGLSFAPRLGLESSLPGSDALGVGEAIDYFAMSYRLSDEVNYGIANLTAYLRVKLLPLFGRSESKSIFSPYVELGGGLGFIAVADYRADAQNENYGTINAQARAAIGIRGVRLSPRLSLGARCDLCAVFQRSRPFWLLGGGLALRYGL